jgi:hypothetical protein
MWAGRRITLVLIAALAVLSCAAVVAVAEGPIGGDLDSSYSGGGKGGAKDGGTGPKVTMSVVKISMRSLSKHGKLKVKAKLARAGKLTITGNVAIGKKKYGFKKLVATYKKAQTRTLTLKMTSKVRKAARKKVLAAKTKKAKKKFRGKVTLLGVSKDSKRRTYRKHAKKTLKR